MAVDLQNMPNGQSVTTARSDATKVAAAGSATPVKSSLSRRVGDTITKYVGHKGHRNLLVRFVCAWTQMSISLSLLSDKAQLGTVAFFQFLTGVTLFVQWRIGNPWMFVGRAWCSWLLVACHFHGMICGRTWPWEENACDTDAWKDIRIPVRCVLLLLGVRTFLNGLSLYLQFKFPHRMLWDRGNEQLFFRGFIHASGLILDVTKYSINRFHLDDSKHERSTWEELSEWLRFCVHFAASWSLFNQWWYTGKGNSGHPLSDAYEELRRQGNSTRTALRSMHGLAAQMHMLATTAEELAGTAKEVALTATASIRENAVAIGHSHSKDLGVKNHPHSSGGSDCTTMEADSSIVAEEVPGEGEDADVNGLRHQANALQTSIHESLAITPRHPPKEPKIRTPEDSDKEDDVSLTWV